MTISGNDSVRVFYVTAGDTFKLQNITVTNGREPTDHGGGLSNFGTTTIANSTFINNRAATQSGGALHNGNTGTLTVINSTITGNNAHQMGGGLMNAGGTTTLLNSTFAGNSSYNQSDSRTIRNFGAGTVTVRNSIFIASSGNCSGTISGSNNLANDSSCGAGFTNTASILLGTLGNYGGSTQTFPLLAGSAAIDAGDDAVCAAAPVSGKDQRGVTRPQGAHCDIGAYEVDATAPIVNSFTAAAFSASQDIAITAFTASDNLNVTGYLITESSAVPSVGAAGWTGAAPSTYTVPTVGDFTLYPWAKDEAGNVSAVFGSPASVTVCSSAITVTSSADSGAGSLRKAIADICPGGTITFDGDTTITLTSTLTISRDMTIDGAGHAVTVDGRTSVRVFHVNPGVTFHLNHLTVANGSSPLDSGGGLLNDGGTVTVTDSTFTNNRAGFGGAIYSWDGTTDGTDGSLTVMNSTFIDNNATHHGGAIYHRGYNDASTLTVTNSTFTDNSTAGYGGGVFNFSSTDNSATATVTDSIFTGNTASRGGGIISYTSGTGVAILNLTGTSLSANTATNGGGGIYNAATMQITDSVLSDNTTLSQGGGLYNSGALDLTDTTLSNNGAKVEGGGFFNNGWAAVSNSTFTDNSSDGFGGGISNTSRLDVTGSTFSGNTATHGGGIRNAGTLNVSNSTFWSNDAASAGGGIYNWAALNLTNNTFAGNSAPSGGGLFNDFGAGGRVTAKNNIVASSPSGGNCLGTLDGSSNLADDASCGVGFTNSDKIRLDPAGLQPNGGPTDTIALQSGSSALGTGDADVCAAAPVSGLDQRGETRPQGDERCDIGAYESSYETVSPTVSSVVRANNSPTDAESIAFIVTFSESVLAVDTSDFALQVTGHISGAEIKTVTGTGSTRTVTVDTGSGNGVIRLIVPAGATITDVDGNSMAALPFTSGESYTILKVSSFPDVPTGSWAWSYVERIYNAGITSGCDANSLQYCPDGSVTRAQMAVFLLRGIHGSAYKPPAVGGSTGFTDVPAEHWAAAWIKQLAVEDITGGCGSGKYCPEAPVTRAQMAVFLLRAKHGRSYAPPGVGNSTGFGDVQPSHWAAAWIKQLVAEGITAGCGNGNYCPEQPVTRAQMAVLLVRAFNLP